MPTNLRSVSEDVEDSDTTEIRNNNIIIIWPIFFCLRLTLFKLLSFKLLLEVSKNLHFNSMQNSIHLQPMFYNVFFMKKAIFIIPHVISRSPFFNYYSLSLNYALQHRVYFILCHKT